MIMIRNLVFDFGKVLVDYDFRHIISKFFNDSDKEERFFKIATNDEFMDMVDKEEKPFDVFIEEQQRKYPEFKDAFRKFHDHYPDFVTGEVPGMHELLIELKEKGYRLYGLTNWCSAVHEIMRNYDIFKLLDGRVISSEEKLIKPDTAIYKRLCEKYGIKPEESLFTDDKIRNIEGAKEAGMHAVLFKDCNDYKNQLYKLGILEK